MLTFQPELPLFVWTTGQPSRWAITRTGTPVLTYGGGWPEISARAPDELYLPLDRPEIFEEFAAIGELAVAAADNSPSPSYRREYETEDGSRVVTVDESELAQVASAEGDRQIQKRLLQFIRAYGPTRTLTAAESKPRRFGDQWSVGITVGELLMDAAVLHRTMELARDVERLANAYDVDRAEQLRKMRLLTSRLSEEMDGTRLIMIIDETDGMAPKLRPTSTCTDLFGAMWLQLYEAVSRGASWRSCKGCGRLFSPRREKQTYHSASCRNRANVRRHAAKQNAGGTS